MAKPHVRAAWIGFFTVSGGAALASLLSLVAGGASVAALTATWAIGAMAIAVWAWNTDARPNDLRFTAEGWSVLGWMCVFFLPPLGIAIGLVLRARGSAQGLPMVVVSCAAIALYAVLAELL